MIAISYPPDRREECHKLDLLEQKSNGDELWGCPHCGHERIINWLPPPDHKNRMTVMGDFFSRHCCSTRPLELSGLLEVAVNVRYLRGDEVEPLESSDSDVESKQTSTSCGPCCSPRKSK